MQGCARDMVTCTGHIGIHEGAEIRTYGRTDGDDVMAIKPNFLTSYFRPFMYANVTSTRNHITGSSLKLIDEAILHLTL